jgi:hypothetical protein
MLPPYGTPSEGYGPHIDRRQREGDSLKEGGMIQPIYPSIDDLNWARREFNKIDPHDLFYKIATELIELAIKKRTNISVAEGLAALLQTWNRSYYRFNKFDSEHFERIERLVNDTLASLLKIGANKAECTPDKIAGLFSKYEDVLGPVGASKCLHLLAPRSFPLWDRKISEGYGVAIQVRGHNSKLYTEFFEHAQEQCRRIGRIEVNGKEVLKAIDEYNFCRFTRGLLQN